MKSLAASTPAPAADALAPDIESEDALVRNGSLPEYVYAQLRQDIFDMRLLPGDQITETEIAAYFKVSRTPVRQALQRLQNDGLMQGYVRGGWEVVPIDFKRFADLYEMRKLIETHAVRRLCTSGSDQSVLADLRATWCLPAEAREPDGPKAAQLDEIFHQTLVRAAGNQEMAETFDRLTDRIRIVRRLDFLYGDCLHSTYEEHAAILDSIAAGDAESAMRLMGEHIDGSHAEVNQITLHRLHSARATATTKPPAYVSVRVRRSF
ncbi:GntR family transcriptional regulator [Herbaspirillum rubrisubalbicans]|uniref:GntR family transcriptional regulator n=1 Tax=Herbaspirillum rubrisubalbicans TaxID=80842 RepID=A0ABX9C735_9BURK|nr:GntR family transcriptional regulator [Herbaspirillum rubrisubalbicans]RAM66230.1 GntR family transcriptional regulator [Herbaspirillum rubrisubalbicans]RAN50334.1 GntR family transcriptional regulator [Herbaspirillum rubrisubalbicans]